MSRTFLVFLILLGIFTPQACTSNEVVVEAQAPATQEAPVETQATKTHEATPEMPSLPVPDLVINPSQAQKETKVVLVTLGKVFAITPPNDIVQWRISFADSVIEALTPKELMDNPGEQGWLFRAFAIGMTEIRLTSVTPVCDSPLPCPPAPPQVITFTLEVK